MPGSEPRPSLLASCVGHCRDRAAMRRTVTVALIVGTLLTLINQGDRLASGDADLAVALRVAANYLIPWIVSSIGYISARRAAGGGDAQGAPVPDEGPAEVSPPDFARPPP